MNPMLHYNLPWCCLESRLVSEFVSDCLDNSCFDSHLTSDSSMSMETTALLQMAVPIIVLNLLLPSVDTVTDLITIIKLYLGGHGCIDENVFSIHDQLAACERNPAEYCSTNQSALCTVSEDNGTYTCISRAHRDQLWQQCIADPRGFCGPRHSRCFYILPRSSATSKVCNNAARYLKSKAPLDRLLTTYPSLI